MRQPDWIGVGVAGCATTWTFHRLAKHPEIGGEIKELNLFNDYSPAKAKEYGNYFAKFRPERWVGEWSPKYWNNPEAPNLIKKHCPEWVKILVILRNPMDRFYASGKKNLGLYFRHLRRWKDTFGEQVGVFFYDDLQKNPRRFLKTIYEFLGVSHLFIDRSADLTPQKPTVYEWDKEILNFYIPSIKRLEDYLEKDLTHWYRQ